MSNFLIFILILAAVAAVCIYLNKKHPPKNTTAGRYPATPAKDKTIFTEILDRETNNLFIAGLEHHCTKKDVGFFTGKIFSEADNPYDNKAMAIGSNQAGKIIGYIPSAVLVDYRKWCKRQDCRCVGFIFFDGEHLRGRVRAYLPETEPEKITQDVKEYISIAADHFNWDITDAEIVI